MGSIRDQKSQTAIRDAIVSRIRTLDPTIAADPGSVVRDVFADAPSGQVRDLYVMVDYINSIKSLDGILKILQDTSYLEDLQAALPEFTLDEIRDLISSDLDDLVSNYGMTRSPATKAKYRQRFYRPDNNGGVAITIAVGTKVKNLDGSVQAQVVSTSAQIPTRETTVGMYYVEATVEALIAGTSGNVANGALAQFVAAIPALATSTANVELLSGGADEQSDSQLAQAAKDAFRGRNLNTRYGYENLLKAAPVAFSDVAIIGPNDPLMLRAPSGAVDLYVIGGESTTISETALYQGGETLYLLQLQPATSIVSVVGSSSGNIPKTNNWQFSSDTGAYARSAKARNYLEVLNPAVFTDGETITITYTYDSQIDDAQNLIESDEYDVPGNETLVKLATQVAIDIDAELVYTGTVSVATVKSSVQSDLAKFFTGGVASTGVTLAFRGINESVDKSDLIAVITAVSGVDRVDLDTFKVYTVRAGVKTLAATDPVAINGDEYARMGTVVFV